MNHIIKTVLAALFFACLLDMPYSYFQLVRFLALVGFLFLAYESYKQNKLTSVIIYGALAVLFQPLVKVSLGRQLWNIVDVIVGIGLLASIFVKSKDKPDEHPGNG